MSSSITSSSAYSIGRSLAVIAIIEYLRPTLNDLLYNVTGAYSGLISRAIIVYLQFLAYSQGWISIPSTMMLSA